MTRFLIYIVPFLTPIITMSQSAMDSLDLGDVVIVARKIDSFDPLVVHSIPSSKIQSVQLGQDPSVLLAENTPSILFFSDSGTPSSNYIQFRLRGMDQSRINTSIDGVPMNDMMDQGVFFSNLSNLLSSVNSIRIQRGIGITNGGTASYAGALEFETKSPFVDSSSTTMNLMAGSFGALGLSAELASGITKDGWAARSRISKLQSDGYKTHSGSDSYSLFFSGGKRNQNEKILFTAFAGKSQNDQAYLPVLIDDIQADPKTNYNHPNDTDDFEQELFHLRYQRTISPNTQFQASAYYGHAGGYFPFGLDNTTQLVFGLDNKHFGIISTWQYERSGWKVASGLHGYVFKRKNENYTAPDISAPDYTDSSSKDEFSLFGKASKDLGNLRLYADVQLRVIRLTLKAPAVLSYGGMVPTGSFNHGRSWSFLNSKLGLSYQLSQDLSAFATFGRSNREPTRADILQGDGSSINEFNLASAQNEDIVREESVYDFEMGLQLDKSHFSLSINLFYMDFKNEISQVGALAARSYVPIRQNIVSSSRSGIEITTEYRPSPQLHLSLQASRLHSSVDHFDNGFQVYEDVEHIFLPEWIIQSNLNWKALSHIGLIAQARFVSSSFMELSNDPLFQLHSHFILNTGLEIKWGKAVKMQLGLNNIFDSTYFTDGAPVDLDFDGLSEGPGFRIQPPRNYYIQASYSF